MKRRGFTLIEIMVGLAVLSLGLAGMVSLFSYGKKTYERSSQILAATLLGQRKLEEVSMRGYEAAQQLIADTSDVLPFQDSTDQIVYPSFRWKLEGREIGLNGSGNLLRVKVSIVWPWPENIYQLSFVTYLARR
ncbi:MAG: prepilin-type N-terminal cleavage/methylation domain-containing protein [Candidatus Tectomicrobia bacterium]|nr:prepilin-type N-terminal cleavage/methylation domain-containing protein [Candidatus Tectomicrobia bacterium]